MRALLLTGMVLFAGICFADGDFISREALRDGLWGIARLHASELPEEEGRLVTLESYAREAKWKEILSSLDSWGAMENPAFAGYRAYALAQLGNVAEAVRLLGATSTTNAAEARRLCALQAVLLLEQGQAARALQLVDKSLLEQGDPEERLVAADVARANGETNRAGAIWREVARMPAADEKLRANAALLSDDLALMTNLLPQIRNETDHGRLALRIALHNLSDTNQWTDSVLIIRDAAHRQPDRPDVQPAYLAYARTALLAGRDDEAAGAYRDALEIWPALARDTTVQEERGWACRRLGRIDEALDAFRAAEDATTNDLQHAKIALIQGDTLAEAGRVDEAMACYRVVMSKYPGTPAGKKLARLVKCKEMEVKGRELYRTFQFDEARRVFAELAKEDPARADKMAYLDVLCLYGLNRDAEAVAKAQTLSARAADPVARMKALHWLAKYAYGQSRWKEASARFEAYADGAPGDVDAPAAIVWAARAAHADGAFERAVELSTRRLREWPKAPGRAGAYLVQGEALIALSRFAEAVLVLERASEAAADSPADRLTARMLKADALFAMGADNPVRYEEALLAYHMVGHGEVLTPSRRLVIAYKVARTLEKLGRLEGALDEYYANVVLAYRTGRLAGVIFDDDARAVFVKAAFRLANEYERRGLKMQAERILELVAASDVPAAAEAERRIDRLQTGGFFP